MVQPALLRLVFHFVVGQGRVAAAAPVDDVFALVDVALPVQLHKDLAHGPGQTFVQGEALARPVDGIPEAADLVQDARPVLLAPLPDALHKGFAPEIVPGFAFIPGKGALHHVLRGDAGVVSAGNPEHVPALLPRVAAEHVHEGVVQRMAHVQRPGDVGRGNDDGKGLSGRGGVGREGAVAFPVFTPAGFHGVGFVPFREGVF